MAEIGVKELKSTASAVIDRVEGGAAYVVTKRGRPAASCCPSKRRKISCSRMPTCTSGFARSARRLSQGRTVKLEDLG